MPAPSYFMDVTATEVRALLDGWRHLFWYWQLLRVGRMSFRTAGCTYLEASPRSTTNAPMHCTRFTFESRHSRDSRGVAFVNSSLTSPHSPLTSSSESVSLEISSKKWPSHPSRRTSLGSLVLPTFLLWYAACLHQVPSIHLCWFLLDSLKKKVVDTPVIVSIDINCFDFNSEIVSKELVLLFSSQLLCMILFKYRLSLEFRTLTVDITPETSSTVVMCSVRFHFPVLIHSNEKLCIFSGITGIYILTVLE